MSQVLKNDKFARSSIRGTVALGRKSQGSVQNHTGTQKCVNEKPSGRGKVALSLCRHRATGSQRLEHISGQETWLVPETVLDFKLGEEPSLRGIEGRGRLLLGQWGGRLVGRRC